MNEALRVKIWFGSLAIFGFFGMAFFLATIKDPSDLLIFAFGQISIVFVLIYRHVFKSGFKIE